jgi:exopolysaccharide production protein ExoZ
MIKGIQLLRGIAALAVVFVHCHVHHADTGMFGVDIFFVISGFIIAYMVNQTTKQFIIKRIIRVCPLYFLATFLTMALAFIQPLWFNHVIITAEAVVKSFFYIPYQIKESGPILSLGWTLNNEMFFYGVMFLCILIFRKKNYLVPACAAILILLLVVLNSFSRDTISANSYILRFYRNGLLPEFIYGLGLYYFWSYYKSEKVKIAETLMIAMGVVAFLTMIYFDLNSAALWLPRNIRYGIPSLLFVNTFLMMENRINQKNIIVKIGLKLGDASYAMYLFHPFVLHFLLRVIYPKLIGPSTLLWVEMLELFIILISVGFVSVLIYKFVDKPSSKFFKKMANRYNEIPVSALQLEKKLGDGVG